jgi:hypothetical protein
MHRFDHECNFNFVEEQRKKLEKENPKVMAEKLERF